jgi:hypothetical protein
MKKTAFPSARVKQHLKAQVYEYLYGPVELKNRQRIKELVFANSKALASSQEGFMYKGNWYSLNASRIPPRIKNRLISSLQPAMDEHLTAVNRLYDHEKPYVLGFVSRVLNASGSIDDYLRVFPESMHPPLKEVADAYPAAPSVITESAVASLQADNETAITLMKSRLILNLLLQ